MSRSILNLVRTEPAMITSAVQAVIGVIATFGFTLTPGREGAILAATTAALGLTAAAATRPFQVSALTGLTSAVVTLLLAFGVHGIQPSLVASLNASITAVSLLIVRGHVTPVANLNAKPAPAGPPHPAS